MNSLTKYVFPLIILFFVFSTSANARRNLKISRAKFLNQMSSWDNSLVSAYSTAQEDFETYYYDQTLDHFNYAPESYTTFRQKYVINSKHWGGANSSSPIFAYLGAEDSLDDDLPWIGIPLDNLPYFKALFVCIEHRYYGESIPFNSASAAMLNASNRAYFSSAQALADYAEVLLYIKEKYASPDSPIIAFGGSYGGMLAAWFRLKYPHIIYGSLASSAPILYFDNITPDDGYFSIVSKDFKVVSENCHNIINSSWPEIEKIGSQPDGLSVLAQRFNTCTPLNQTSDLIDHLYGVYTGMAQYNDPSNKRVASICSAIEEANNGSDIVDGIIAGALYAARQHNLTCVKIYDDNPSASLLDGWNWQSCTEMVIPFGISEENGMFPPEPFNLTQYVEYCKSTYGVTPRTHWATTYYGGHDIKQVLQKFASNIIFSNGLVDPYSIGGVLEDLSDGLIAVHTVNGPLPIHEFISSSLPIRSLDFKIWEENKFIKETRLNQANLSFRHHNPIDGPRSHCLDIDPAKPDDPEWLVNQRQIELNIIEGWIGQYYSDLSILKDREKIQNNGQI